MMAQEEKKVEKSQMLEEVVGMLEDGAAILGGASVTLEDITGIQANIGKVAHLLNISAALLEANLSPENVALVRAYLVIIDRALSSIKIINK